MYNNNINFINKIKKIADDFYSGKINENTFTDPYEKRFLDILKTYRTTIDNLAKNSKARWHDHTVISGRFPPVFSNIEKEYLINSVLDNPIQQDEIAVAISYGCKCNCKQCYITDFKDPNRKELSVGELKNVFQNIIDIGAWHIDITGGEPFDHPQFFEIMDQIPKDKATTMVATNGLNLNEETIENIKKSNIMLLKVSLDSYKKSVHDKNRAVKNSYDHVINGIKLLQKNNIYFFINAFVEKECWLDNELEKRIQVCMDLGITKFNIVTPLNIGNLKNRQDLLLTLKDREYIYSLKNKYENENIIIHVFPDWELRKGCFSGRGRIYINPYGDIYPCNFDTEKCYGNILKDNLSDVIKAMHKDIPERRKYCVSSNVTLDLLESLGVKYDVFMKNKPIIDLYRMFKSFKDDFNKLNLGLVK